MAFWSIIELHSFSWQSVYTALWMLCRVELTEVQPSNGATAEAFLLLQCRGGLLWESELKQQSEILLLPLQINQ